MMGNFKGKQVMLGVLGWKLLGKGSDFVSQLESSTNLGCLTKEIGWLEVSWQASRPFQSTR